MIVWDGTISEAYFRTCIPEGRGASRYTIYIYPQHELYSPAGWRGEIYEANGTALFTDHIEPQPSNLDEAFKNLTRQYMARAMLLFQGAFGLTTALLADIGDKGKR